MAKKQSEITRFRRKVLSWYRRHGRDFPWRETNKPFHLLLAELMLRRTRANQVVPVYEAFIRAYPDPESLSRANEIDIADAVYSIGLSWRVPAFKSVAQRIVEEHDGMVPSTREDLKEMEGVGDYVAGAVLSIAFGQREWIVDANVARILKRYFGLTTIKEVRRDKLVIGLAKRFANSSRVREAHLGLLDLASLICKSGIPLCDKCPLANGCAFYEEILRETS